MLRSHLIIRTLLFLAATLSWGFVPFVPPALLGLKYTIEKESSLSIRGTTNINSFECFSKQTFKEQSVRMEIDGGSQRVVFKNAQLMLRVDGLDCDNSKMNEDLCEALDYEDFPFIVIELHEANLKKGLASDGWSEIIVRASLSVAGKTRRVYIKAKGQQTSPDRFRFVAEYWLKMTDYGVEPPTALLGLIQVRDDIAIDFDVVAKVNAETTL